MNRLVLVIVRSLKRFTEKYGVKKKVLILAVLVLIFYFISNAPCQFMEWNAAILCSLAEAFGRNLKLASAFTDN